VLHTDHDDMDIVQAALGMGGTENTVKIPRYRAVPITGNQQSSNSVSEQMGGVYVSSAVS